eukprot:2413785-Amphidinium_carterae.2
MHEVRTSGRVDLSEAPTIKALHLRQGHVVPEHGHGRRPKNIPGLAKARGGYVIALAVMEATC